MEPSFSNVVNWQPYYESNTVFAVCIHFNILFAKQRAKQTDLMCMTYNRFVFPIVFIERSSVRFVRYALSLVLLFHFPNFPSAPLSFCLSPLSVSLVHLLARFQFPNSHPFFFFVSVVSIVRLQLIILMAFVSNFALDLIGNVSSVIHSFFLLYPTGNVYVFASVIRFISIFTWSKQIPLNEGTTRKCNGPYREKECRLFEIS